MKIKNSELIAKINGLTDIINRREKYPVKFSFALSKNLKAMGELNKDFETARNKLLDEFNVKDESGQPAYQTTGKIEIPAENAGEWKKSMDELLDIEVELNVHTVSESILDGIEIEPDVLYICDFMFE